MRKLLPICLTPILWSKCQRSLVHHCQRNANLQLQGERSATCELSPALHEQVPLPLHPGAQPVPGQPTHWNPPCFFPLWRWGERQHNSSLARSMDKAMQLVDSLTQSSRTSCQPLELLRTEQSSLHLTSNTSSLPHPPAVACLHSSTLCSKGSFQSSTHVRKPLLPSHTTKPILSPVGIVFLQASSTPPHPLPSVQMAPSWRYVRKEE